MSVTSFLLFFYLTGEINFFENEVILKGFNCQKLGGGKKKRDNNNHQISIFGFKCIAIINIEDLLMICTQYLVYSQIRLNLPMDDCHFLYFFLTEDHHLGYIKKII
jgi:hypothetical protein